MSVILNPPILSRSRAEGQEVNRDRNNGPVQTQQTMARGSSSPVGSSSISHHPLHVSPSALPHLYPSSSPSLTPTVPDNKHVSRTVVYTYL